MQAEKLNGRAAMIGYVLALGVDKLTGAGLADQQGSFLGLVALHLTVFSILLFRTTASVPALKNLLEEATFYDKQWAATCASPTSLLPLRGRSLHVCLIIIIWLSHNLVEASFDLFRYLLLGDQLKPWELHPLVS